MRDNRKLAVLALALVEGSLRDGEAADSMFVDTFESIEEAAHAHAYLSGYVLQFAAARRGESVEQTIAELRRTLN